MPPHDIKGQNTERYATRREGYAVSLVVETTRSGDQDGACWQELETASLQISQTPEWKALEDHVTEIERT